MPPRADIQWEDEEEVEVEGLGPRQNAMIFDATDSISSDGQIQRNDAKTDEEWTEILKEWKEGGHHDDVRRAVGPQEWKEIVDSFASESDVDRDYYDFKYPGRRLMDAA